MSYNPYTTICKHLYSMMNVDDMTEGSFLISDDNTKFTVKRDKSGTTFIQKDADEVQLDLKSFYDYDLWNSYDEMDSLLDGDKKLEDDSVVEIISENAIEYFFDDCFGKYLSGDESYFNPLYDKKKMDIFSKRGLNPVSMIKIDSAYDKPLVNGVVLDLKTNDRFVDVYKNGISFDMPKSRELYAKQQKLRFEGKLDIDDDDYVEDEITDEINQLVRTTIDSMDGTAEYSLNGMYVVLCNQMYYVTKEELDAIFGNIIDYPSMKIIQDILVSKDGFDKLLDKMKLFVSDENRSTFDITDMEATGVSAEEVLCALVTGDDVITSNINNILFRENYQKIINRK